MGLVLVSLLAWRFFTPEDTWICQQGKWEKHGQPTSGPPTFGCVVTDFLSCTQAGNPVMESYPRQCRAETGEIFVEDIGNELEKMDLIRLHSPRPGEEIASPVLVSGEARGNWFFEGSFPVFLVDWDGLIIAEGLATAQSEWMTEEFVPFTVELKFDKPSYKNNGALILKKDNPSGLPQYDDALEIPVYFK